jgi:hypothetical protein
MQLFGLRKTPVLSLALGQALSPLSVRGLSTSNGRLVRTARSHILPNLSDTRSVRNDRAFHRARGARSEGGQPVFGTRAVVQLERRQTLKLNRATEAA